MKRVEYINKFGIKCIRHGTIKKNSTHYVFTPSDSTKKKEISFEDFISATRCRTKKQEMIYVHGKYIPKADDPT